MEYIGDDPRNETTFIINDVKASLDSLDEPLMKKKKESRSKFCKSSKRKRIWQKNVGDFMYSYKNKKPLDYYNELEKNRNI